MNELRLESLQIENFRSITGSWTIPLDAQVILVHGPNGSGKTSLLSAIELAATGNVAFLSDQLPKVHDALLNRNYPLGKVQLRLRSMDGPTLSGTIALSSGRVEGSAALSDSEKVLFLERCFLPQTALGRLLETYTASGKQVDNALVRFVKTLVGLDELDSLIDGLKPAGHLARARAASRHWEDSERKLKAAVGTREGIRVRLQRAQTSLTEALGSLRELHGVTVEEIPDRELPRYVVAMRDSEGSGFNDLSEYDSLRVQLEGISAAYVAGLGDKDAQSDPVAQSEAASRAVSAYNDWESGPGALALARLNQIRAAAFSLSMVPASQIFEAFEACQTLLTQETRRRTDAELRRLDAEKTRGRLSGEIDAMVAEQSTLRAAADSAQVPQDVRVLLDLLEKTLVLVDSDVCPICDQTFSLDGSSLRKHLQQKVGLLTRGARDLMETNARLQRLEVKLGTRRSELESIVPPPREEEALLKSVARDLNSLDEVITRGLNLLREMERTEARKSLATSRRATQDVANRHLVTLRDKLKLDSVGLEISEEIDRLGAIIERLSQAASFERTRRAREAEAAASAEEYTQLVAELTSALASVDDRISVLDRAIKEATARKNAANNLRLDTERVRSSVINRVFDHTLNNLWADLFNRFVPTEPFVPRFRRQTRANRSVDIRLETILPNDDVAGPPSAMLSYGNTNTAALSLFIALHLSAPTNLPWLIFDDPVQSMDDIHVANFAAVVRQLSYSHGRQVIIAVHQQELFEYLALELAPATPAESLLKVNLSRRAEATMIHTERVHNTPEPLLTRSALQQEDSRH